MTSKEFIEWQMLDCSYNQKKYYNQVLKDLEVLEILKQLAKEVIDLKEKNIDITKYVVLISESTNEKIKEWFDGNI